MNENELQPIPNQQTQPPNAPVLDPAAIYPSPSAPPPPPPGVAAIPEVSAQPLPTPVPAPKRSIVPIVIAIGVALTIAIGAFLIISSGNTARDDLGLGLRDNQRRNDTSRAMSQINSFQANNRGDIPGWEFTTRYGQPTNSDDSNFLDRYLRRNDMEITSSFRGTYIQLGGEFRNPQTGGDYGFVTDPTGNRATTDTFAYSGPGFRCDRTTNNFTDSAMSPSRSIALRIQLESGEFYCQDNQ